VRWLGALDYCRAHDVAVKEGDDRGMFAGRAKNGYCAARVDCRMSFYTNQLASCSSGSSRPSTAASTTRPSSTGTLGTAGGDDLSNSNVGGGDDFPSNNVGGDDLPSNNVGGNNWPNNVGGGNSRNPGQNNGCNFAAVRADVNLWGGDLSKVTARSAQECCSACGAYPQCGAWTWIGPNSSWIYTASRSTCYLKKASGWTSISAAGLVSGY
jgi:hypothetical protein